MTSTAEILKTARKLIEPAKTFRRIFFGVACIGNGSAAYNVAPVIWPIDPLSSSVVLVAVGCMMAIQFQIVFSGELPG